jgi:hypothetical protein
MDAEAITYTLVSVLRPILKAREVPGWWWVPTTWQMQLLCPCCTSSPQKSQLWWGTVALGDSLRRGGLTEASHRNDWERPILRHSTSLRQCHGNVDSGKTLNTTCLARHWKVLLPKHSTITFCIQDTGSQPLTITTCFYGTQKLRASFLMLSRWQNQHFSPHTKPAI